MANADEKKETTVKFETVLKNVTSSKVPYLKLAVLLLTLRATEAESLPPHLKTHFESEFIIAYTDSDEDLDAILCASKGVETRFCDCDQSCQCVDNAWQSLIKRFNEYGFSKVSTDVKGQREIPTSAYEAFNKFLAENTNHCNKGRRIAFISTLSQYNIANIQSGNIVRPDKKRKGAQQSFGNEKQLKQEKLKQERKAWVKLTGTHKATVKYQIKVNCNTGGVNVGTVYNGTYTKPLRAKRGRCRPRTDDPNPLLKRARKCDTPPKYIVPVITNGHTSDSGTSSGPASNRSSSTDHIVPYSHQGSGYANDGYCSSSSPAPVMVEVDNYQKPYIVNDVSRRAPMYHQPPVPDVHYYESADPEPLTSYVLTTRKSENFQTSNSQAIGGLSVQQISNGQVQHQGDPSITLTATRHGPTLTPTDTCHRVTARIITTTPTLEELADPKGEYTMW